MKLKLISIALILLLIGCKKEDGSVDGNLNIRIKNSSNFTYQSLKVNTSGGINFYDELNANSASEYKSFTSAYRYAYIELIVDGETLKLQPIDYVGENQLDIGKYTYVIGVENSSSGNKALTLEFQKD